MRVVATEILNTYISFEYDGETGNYYCGARLYSPTSGRFLSEEPLGIDGPNLYWYTRNNPVNYIDLNGLDTIGISFGGSFGGGEGEGRGTFNAAASGVFIGTKRCSGIGVGAGTATASGDSATGAFGGLSVNFSYGFGDVEDTSGNFKVEGYSLGPISLERYESPYGGRIVGFGFGISFKGFGIGAYKGKGEAISTSGSNTSCPCP